MQSCLSYSCFGVHEIDYTLSQCDVYGMNLSVILCIQPRTDPQMRKRDLLILSENAHFLACAIRTFRQGAHDRKKVQPIDVFTFQ